MVRDAQLPFGGIVRWEVSGNVRGEFSGTFFTGKIFHRGNLCTGGMPGWNCPGRMFVKIFSGEIYHGGGVLEIFAIRLLTLNSSSAIAAAAHGFGRRLTLIFQRDISPILPVIFTWGGVRKSEILPKFSTALALEPPSFRSGATYRYRCKGSDAR